MRFRFAHLTIERLCSEGNLFLGLRAQFASVASESAGPLFWLGISFYALAMLKDAAWPRWVGLTGLVFAFVAIAANWVLASNWVALKLVIVLAYAWLAMAGFVFSRFTSVGTEGPSGVSAPADAYKSGERVPTR